MYSIKEAHYKFKQHANKVDGLRNANFLIPQIDEYIFEAYIIYVENICEQLELNQKRRDDIRQLEIKDLEIPVIKVTDEYYTANLPDDYYRYLESYSLCKNEKCENKKKIKNYIIQKDDIYVNDPMFNSSFTFERVNLDLSGNKLYLYYEDFDIEKVFLTYIRKPLRPGNPVDFLNGGGTYNLPNGTPAVQRDIEIDSTFQANKIIDIAVLIAMRDVGNTIDFESQLNKILNISKI
jgi:hypothetical protein